MSANDKPIPTVTITSTRRPSTDSYANSLKTPRTARFAEATSVNSPVEPTRSPFADPPTNHYAPQPQPADVGFGYLNNRTSGAESQSGVEMEETDRRYLPPPTPKSPLKSALKSPGAPPRNFEAVLSPTFREEQVLEKHEEDTEKEQAKDLKVKFRVRVAKLLLRGVNFSCSLIVVSMLAATFTIFNATKHLPARSNLPPWAEGTQTWPQILLLVIAGISLLMSIVILAAYWRGGHKRAEKVAVYYTTFAVAFFIFSIVMWAVGAAILNSSKANGGGQDMWGWACKDNKRRELFEQEVQYALVCRLQDWALVCCIIEIVVETLTIIVYGIVFYRFWSKRKLRRSMAVRDRARSDLYLAQLRSQSAPNTPGFGPPPLTPGDGWKAPPGHPRYVDPLSAAENGHAESPESTQYPRGFAEPKPFQLQAPPIRVQGATPKVQQNGFDSNVHDVSPPSSRHPSPPLDAMYHHQPSPPQPPSPSFAAPQEHVQEHVPAAPGEVQYEAVPIPGAYGSAPMASPSYPPQPQQHGFDFGIPHHHQQHQ